MFFQKELLRICCRVPPWKPPNLLDNDWNVLWSSIFRKYTWKRRHSVLEGFHKFVKFIKFWRQLHFFGTSAPFHWQSISNSTQSKWMEYSCHWKILANIFWWRRFALWNYRIWNGNNWTNQISLKDVSYDSIIDRTEALYVTMPHSVEIWREDETRRNLVRWSIPASAFHSVLECGEEKKPEKINFCPRSNHIFHSVWRHSGTTVL